MLPTLDLLVGDAAMKLACMSEKGDELAKMKACCKKFNASASVLNQTDGLA